MLLPEWSLKRCPVIGMLHSPALPGAPDYRGNFVGVRDAVLRDAETLVSGGIDGLMLENYGDSPFYPGRVPAITVAAMTSLATELRMKFDVPLGINVLRNDGQSALAIAAVCGASFIRVNVLCGARVADQGVLQAIAHDLLRERMNLGATGVRIWADVNVKHSVALAARPATDEVHDLIERGKADAVIVTGYATGMPVESDYLRAIKAASGPTPVIIGSGASEENVCQLAPFASGIIVGSSLKRDGKVGNPVDPNRVTRLIASINSATLNG